MNYLTAQCRSLILEYPEEDIYQAVYNGHCHTILRWIRRGLSVNFVFTSCADTRFHGMTMLHLAVAEHQVQLVQLLISENADVNKAFQLLSFNGKETKVKVTMEEDRLQSTCLFQAICSEDTKITNMLVCGGADVNLYDHSHCTALWHAVDTNNIHIATAVLKAPDCDVNAVDNLNMTSLHVAAVHGNSIIMEKLLLRGAIVDARQIQGASALFAACASGCLATVQLLLSHGADPNLQDKDKLHPLFTALGNSKEPGLIYLAINSGAIVSSKHVFRFHRQHKILDRHQDLKEYVYGLLDTPRSLKILSARKIKELLGRKTHGKSIFGALGALPLPRTVISYMRLE